MAELRDHPRPLIHLGYPKALSSWMQKHLFQPPQGYITALDPLHTKLNLISTPPFGYDESAVRAVMDDRLASSDDSLVPVITSESLIGNPATGGADAELLARRLHDLAPDATVLVVVREQRAMIRSLYKTLVGFLGFPHAIDRLLEPRDRFAVPQFSTDFLQYPQAVAMYQRIWGADRVVVLPYELFNADAEAFLTAITAKTGAVSTTKPPSDQVVNAGSRILDIQRERIGNMVLEGGPFNYLGLREPTNARMTARLKRINQPRDDNALNRRLEQRFARRVDQLTAGVFATGNAVLQQQCVQSVAGIDLAAYGYDMS